MTPSYLRAIGLAAVAASALLAAPPQAQAQKNSRVDVAAISPYVYPDNAPASPASLTYMPDGLTYLMLSDDGKTISRYDTPTGKLVEKVLDVTHTRDNTIPSVEAFSVSPDGTKLLVYTKKEPVYRRSFRADYYVFEIKRNILRPLSKQFAMQQSPVVSPDGRMVAFVAENNVYVKKIDFDTELPVTTDGRRDTIINGIPDWTYEEEFDTSCSLAWSPDNSTLCYLKYNETRVPKFSFTLYEGTCDPQTQYALYPGEFSYKYPVAGEPNSVVTLHSYDVETRKTKDIALPNPKSTEYIPRIAFAPATVAPDQLIVTTLNRAQTRMEVYTVNPRSTVARSLIVEEAKQAWLPTEAYEKMTLEADGIVLFSERTGWRHLYRYSYSGALIGALTSGDYDVTAYYGADAAGCRYFQSTGLPDYPSKTAAPLNRVLSKISPKGKQSVTTHLTPADGTASATFSPARNYYTLRFSTAEQPPIYTLCDSRNKQLRTLEDNAAYAARVAGMPRREFFSFTSDGVTLNGYIYRPVGFSDAKKYPAVMWQYSGPDSQEVLNAWSLDWQAYAAQREGFVVVCVDPRGTGGRDAAFRNIVYRNLGHYETIDQVNAARYVASLPYVDPARIGICGWSFGGYETLMCATASDCPFAAAVAIAPVTSWRYYDTVYTERFMLTPAENAEGYDQSAPVNRAASMNIPLLIIHGTSDDNVHLSNTIEFTGRLQKADRWADLYLFPGKNHSIYGCGARALVYGRMLSFFKANL